MDRESALIISGFISAYVAWAEKVQKSKKRAAASARRTAALTQEATALAGHWPVGGTDWPMTPDAEGVPAPVGGWGKWVAAQHVSSISLAVYRAMLRDKRKGAARRAAALRARAGVKPEAPAPPPRRLELPPDINARIDLYLSDPVPFAIVRASTIKDVHDAMRATGCHDAYKTWLETEPRPPRWLGVDMEMNTEANRPSPVMGWAAFTVMRARRTRLLNRGPSVCKSTLEGHTGKVMNLVALPEGKLASSGAYEKNIKIWDVATGRGGRELSGHVSPVTALAACADGTLASAGNSTIRIWNVATGVCKRTLRDRAFINYIVTALVALPNGKLAAVYNARTIMIWNVATGQREGTLIGHSAEVTALTVLPNGTLASGSQDKTIKIWNVATGECERTLEGHTSYVVALAVCAGGKLASGSYDKTIKIWDVATGQCERTLQGHAWAVVALATWPGGKLASGSQDKTIKIWNVATGRCERTLEGHTGAVIALTARADGTLASGSRDTTIKIWGDTPDPDRVRDSHVE